MRARVSLRARVRGTRRLQVRTRVRVRVRVSLALVIRKIQPRHGEPPPGGPAWLGVGVRGRG